MTKNFPYEINRPLSTNKLEFLGFLIFFQKYEK